MTFMQCLGSSTFNTVEHVAFLSCCYWMWRQTSSVLTCWIVIAFREGAFRGISVYFTSSRLAKSNNWKHFFSSSAKAKEISKSDLQHVLSAFCMRTAVQFRGVRVAVNLIKMFPFGIKQKRLQIIFKTTTSAFVDWIKGFHISTSPIYNFSRGTRAKKRALGRSATKWMP